jgi:hypothetical protein
VDTTKKYIEMCKQATEIQEKFNYDDGDYFIGDDDQEWNIGGLILDSKGNLWDNVISDDAVAIKPMVWLPRQDQLQEMASLLCNYKTQILKFFNNWIKDNKILISDYRSMEQLWLTFVMHTVYNKAWGSLGNRWIELP